MIIGGYSLELYCDHPKHPSWPNGPHGEFTSEGPNAYHIARRAARKKGWILSRDQTAICPKCKPNKGAQNEH